METDFARLHHAIRVAQEERGVQMRFKARLAGHDVPEPVPEPATEEEFNDRWRDAMAFLKGR